MAPERFSGTHPGICSVGPLLPMGGFSWGCHAAVGAPQVTTRVDVEPLSSALLVGDTVRLTATALNGRGSAIPDRSATWSSSDSTTVDVYADPILCDAPPNPAATSVLGPALAKLLESDPLPSGVGAPTHALSAARKS